MNIHQLSVVYVDEQDRILLRFNTSAGEELSLWLTRRMLSRVMEPLQDAVCHLEARKTPLSDRSAATRRLLADLKRAEVLENSDFSTPYHGRSGEIPTGALLVTQMSMAVQSNRQLLVTFEEHLAQQTRSLQLSMESSMLHGFIHLLELAMRQAQWESAGALNQQSGNHADAEDSAEPRPKYIQ
jgi:hypothetical protein